MRASCLLSELRVSHPSFSLLLNMAPPPEALRPLDSCKHLAVEVAVRSADFADRSPAV